jgi:hypothetical protein
MRELFSKALLDVSVYRWDYAIVLSSVIAAVVGDDDSAHPGVSSWSADLPVRVMRVEHSALRDMYP